MIDETVKDQVIAMASNGLPPRRIVEEIEGKLEIRQVYNVLKCARLRGEVIPSFQNLRGGCRVMLSPIAHEAFQIEAKAREMSPTELKQKLLEMIARDQLYAAILDCDEVPQ